MPLPPRRVRAGGGYTQPKIPATSPVPNSPTSRTGRRTPKSPQCTPLSQRAGGGGASRRLGRRRGRVGATTAGAATLNVRLFFFFSSPGPSRPRGDAVHPARGGRREAYPTKVTPPKCALGTEGAVGYVWEAGSESTPEAQVQETDLQESWGRGVGVETLELQLRTCPSPPPNRDSRARRPTGAWASAVLRPRARASVAALCLRAASASHEWSLTPLYICTSGSRPTVCGDTKFLPGTQGSLLLCPRLPVPSAGSRLWPASGRRKGPVGVPIAAAVPPVLRGER